MARRYQAPFSLPAHLYSSHQCHPKQKTQFIAFYRTTKRNNAGDWRVRAVIKTCLVLPAVGDDRSTAARRAVLKGEKMTDR